MSGNVWKIKSVAVLPLAVEPADRELEFANKWVVEKLIDTISQIPGLRVLAYSTVQRYGDNRFDPRTVGQNLHVQAVTAGEMVRCNDELILHVELIEVDDGTQLWGAQFKEPYFDVLALPEKLADVICSQLRPIIARYLTRRRARKTKRAA